MKIFVKLMILHFQFKIVLNQQFFLFKPVGQFGLELKKQHFKAFQRFLYCYLFLRVHKLKEIFLKRSFGFTFFDVNNVSDEQGVLLGLHPNVWAEFRLPDKVGIFKNSLVYICVVVQKVDGRMLLASIWVLLQFHAPSVDALHHVYGHVPESRHIGENCAEQLNGVLNGCIHLDGRIPLGLNPLHINCIIACLIEVLLLEKSQKFGSLADIPFDFIDAFDAGLNAGVHTMQKIRTR